MAEPASLPALARLTPALREAWARYGAAAEWALAALLAGAAAGRLAKGFYRLLFDQSRTGAVDLRVFQRLATAWFAGKPFYGEVAGSLYPPASQPVLALYAGWLPFQPARWFWAAMTVALLAWLSVLLVQGSGATRPAQRVCFALLPLAVTGSSVAIGNGQLFFHVLPPLLAALLLAARPGGWRNDLLAAGLMILALVKPSLSAPFFWIMVFAPGRWRPAVLTVAGYAALTVFAAAFQGGSVPTLLLDWAGSAETILQAPGHSNLQRWMVAVGWGHWYFAAALAVLAGLGLWVYANRRADLWLLLGAAAVVARLWVYHAVYDDGLILLPLVALFRLARSEPQAGRLTAATWALLATGLGAALAPARLQTLGWPWNLPFELGQTVMWLAMLGFLAWAARRIPQAGLMEAAA